MFLGLTNVCVCMRTHLSMFIWVHMGACVFGFMCTRACVCTCTCVYVCVYMGIFFWVLLWLEHYQLATFPAGLSAVGRFLLLPSLSQMNSVCSGAEKETLDLAFARQALYHWAKFSTIQMNFQGVFLWVISSICKRCRRKITEEFCLQTQRLSRAIYCN